MLGPELISQLTALVSVVLIDIVLAGDNAVVVGTAAAGLPAAQQRKVILLGAGLALVARILFALVAVQLLAIIGLLLAGGILLLWVAWKIWRELHSAGHAGNGAGATTAMAAKTMRSAIVQVAIADISMSLDNVLAVAGAARDHPYIMIFGLLLSIALMAVAAQLIARLIDRHRWIAYVGLGIVLFVAVKMIWEGGLEVFHAMDGVVGQRDRSQPSAWMPAALTEGPT
jgi:YjbE family integral membrane protein